MFKFRILFRQYALINRTIKNCPHRFSLKPMRAGLAIVMDLRSKF